MTYKEEEGSTKVEEQVILSGARGMEVYCERHYNASSAGFDQLAYLVIDKNRTVLATCRRPTITA